MNKDKFFFLVAEKQHYIYIAFCVLLSISFISKFKKLGNKKPATPIISNSVDTFIPKGYVLVPIEIINPDALNDIIGDFGYVDLYSDQSQTNRPKFELLIKDIKLLKSPVDPSIIAVLSPDKMVHSIVTVNKKFKITIKSKSNKETQLARKDKKNKRIIFE